jgi:hypothetical protein
VAVAICEGDARNRPQPTGAGQTALGNH